MTLDNERRLLAVHLKRLRLPTILAEYEKLAQEAAQENAHYLQYLLRLVELESAQRCAHALQARIKQAAFPVYKDLGTRKCRQPAMWDTGWPGCQAVEDQGTAKRLQALCARRVGR